VGTTTILAKVYQAKLKTPFAVLGIQISDKLLTDIEYLPVSTKPLDPQCAVSATVCAQIYAYLADPSYQFSLPLKISGTSFQSKVWQAISRIPSSKTLCYSDIAKKLSSGARAIGQACRANRIPVVIPCHRVIAKHGLGGFIGVSNGSPIEIKRWLLHHEHASY
jgi:methylated-DNA-[protein]-cysteine S-methyltransferase